MIQCTDGYIWLGTDDGVWRFDGTLFQAIQLEGQGWTSPVSSIFGDSNRGLWAGCANGQIARVNAQGNFQLWELEEGWPSKAISQILEDQQGQMWFATYGEGVYCHRNNRFYQFGVDDGLESEDIYDMAIDTQGHILAASDAGLAVLGWKDDQKIIQNFDISDGLPDEIITSLLTDDKGGCWLGAYEDGLAYFRLDDEQVSITQPFSWSGGIISSLALVDGTDLWVGTENDGLFVIPIDTGSYSSFQKQDEGKVQSLFFDQEGMLWVLFRKKGLCSIQSRLSFIKNLPIVPQTILADGDSCIWIGSQSGLYYCNKKENTVQAFLPDLSLNIISIYKDSYGKLWLGTFGEGLYIVDPEHKSYQHYGTEQGLANGSILSIDGRERDVWLATLGGVYLGRLSINGATINFEHLEAGTAIGTDFLYKTFIDQQQRIWFGTDGKGISRMNRDGALTNYAFSSDSIPIRSVYSIAEDGQQRIWISTGNEMIFILENGHFRTIETGLKLQRKEIVTLQSDDLGNMLLIHSNGVAYFDIYNEQLIDYCNFQSDNFDFDPVLNGISRDDRGNIWIAGTKELVYYNSFKGTYRQQAAVSLDKISVNLQQVNLAVHTLLEPNENNLIFSYSAIWMTNPDVVKYRYQLKGFDQYWINTADRQAVYSNLPPGEYEFRVTSTQNGFFDESNIIASTSFRIKTPLFKRAWFIILGLTFIGGVISLLVKQREKRLQRESALLREKVESRYEMLKSQINPHFLFNSFNTLVTLIEDESKLAVTYVEKLADFYRSILQYREQDVVDLKEEISILQDYLYLLKQRYEDNLKIDIQVLPTNVFVPPLALQLLVENAVKHNIISKQKPLTIRIFAKNDYLVVENKIQPKILIEKSTGFGLQNIHNRYELLSDQAVLIEQDQGVFRVYIPLIKNHTDEHSHH